MVTHLLQASFRILALDVIGNLLHFPIWWYSKGLLAAFRFSLNQIKAMANYFALPILFRFWFKPMFGQNDIWGRLISFGVRTVQLLVLLIGQTLWTLFVFILFLLWPLIPLVIGYELLFQFGVLNQAILL